LFGDGFRAAAACWRGIGSAESAAAASAIACAFGRTRSVTVGCRNHRQSSRLCVQTGDTHLLPRASSLRASFIARCADHLHAPSSAHSAFRFSSFIVLGERGGGIGRLVERQTAGRRQRGGIASNDRRSVAACGISIASRSAQRYGALSSSAICAALLPHRCCAYFIFIITRSGHQRKRAEGRQRQRNNQDGTAIMVWAGRQRHLCSLHTASHIISICLSSHSRACGAGIVRGIMKAATS